MKPAGRSTREDCRHGQTPAGGSKDDVGVIGNGAQCVNAATESAPARTEEVILGESVPSGLLKIEGTRGESCWNDWSSRHGPESWARRPRNGTQPKKDSGCWEKRDSTALDSRSAAHSRTKKRGSGCCPSVEETNYIFERAMPPPIPLGIFIVPAIHSSGLFGYRNTDRAPAMIAITNGIRSKRPIEIQANSW